MRRFASFAVILLAFALPLSAADDPAPPGDADAESPHAPSARLVEPRAQSVVSRGEFLNGRPGADLEHAFELVPGTFGQSSRNFAQDARISIRGFGARSTFGVRGVRVLVDDIPTTLPDGQSEVDSIDLFFMERVDVVRGPVSSLYGGGGGGIISFKTVSPTEHPRVRARTTFGSDHLSRYEALATGTQNEIGYVFGATRSRYSGYRDHARAQQDTVLAKFEHDLGDATHATWAFSGVWAPDGQDPGGLTQTEVDADRQQARAGAFTFDTGEKLNQQKVSFAVSHSAGNDGSVELKGYRLWRDFSNALPFPGDPGGRVDLDRTVTGGSFVYARRFGSHRLLLGGDIDFQKDRRRRYENAMGARGAPLHVRQSETVRSIGPFAQLELDLGHGFGAVAGARYDWTEFVVGDRITNDADGDQSNRLRFRQVSPRFGLHYRHSDTFNAFANVSTAFQVPTTTELRPSGAVTGFNTRLDPERALGFEVGAKGAIRGRTFYDVALYHLRLRDVIVPFDNGAAAFARNAAQVHRTGVEIAASTHLRPGLTFRGSYAYADYRYKDYKRVTPTGTLDNDGKREPNIPMHTIGGELRWQHPSGGFATIGVRHFSDLEADDENRNETNGATLASLRAGFALARDGFVLRPFAGIENLSGVEYDGVVRPNAGFGRFFEPTAELHAYAGVEVEFGR